MIRVFYSAKKRVHALRTWAKVLTDFAKKEKKTAEKDPQTEKETLYVYISCLELLCLEKTERQLADQ